MTDVVSEFHIDTEPEPVPQGSVVDDQLVGMLVDRARAEGLQLTDFDHRGRAGRDQRPARHGGQLRAAAGQEAEATADGPGAIHVKIRDGKVANRPIYLVMAVAVQGHRDILGIWAKPVYTAPTQDAATSRFLEFTETWAAKYPAIVRLWENAWAEFVPFLAFDVEIRKVICSTNAIESVNARIRRAVRARGHFPNEAAALKCIYMALMSLDPTGKGRKRWTMRWKAPLNAFQIAFEGRLTPSNN
jgi:hypothetical protein